MVQNQRLTWSNRHNNEVWCQILIVMEGILSFKKYPFLNTNFLHLCLILLPLYCSNRIINTLMIHSWCQKKVMVRTTATGRKRWCFTCHQWNANCLLASHRCCNTDFWYFNGMTSKNIQGLRSFSQMSKAGIGFYNSEEIWDIVK